MAQEICVLSSDGSSEYTLLFLFPIAAPKTAGGSNVVPTPSTTLPDIAAACLTSQEKTALDAGTSAFRLQTMRKDPAFTTPQLTARIKAIYAAALTEFNRWYADTYAFVGTRIDA